MKHVDKGQTPQQAADLLFEEWISGVDREPGPKSARIGDILTDIALLSLTCTYDVEQELFDRLLALRQDVAHHQEGR